MSDNKTKVFFLHLRASKHSKVTGFGTPSDYYADKGGATVAYTYDETGVRYAIAKVNPKDRYEKAIGREVVLRRFAEGKDVGFLPGVTANSFRHIADLLAIGKFSDDRV